MKANDTQEGGDHYRKEELKGNPQHWDLAIWYRWDPFQYQITKYVMRWKDKWPTPEERLVDLKKGLHFYQKYIENWETYDDHRGLSFSVVTQEQLDSLTKTTEPAYTPAETKVETMKTEVISATRTQGILDQNWTCEGYLGDGTNVYKCRHCREEIKALTLKDAYEKHDACSRAHMMFAAP